jgi:putative restriction endonuclease
MLERVPLVYFHAVTPGYYAAAYPVFVVGDDPTALFFSMQVDDLSSALANAVDATTIGEDRSEPRRAYVTASFRRRLHQVAFRERVIRAYRDRCALCRLHHLPLLDAAHITPDADPEGEPVVSNGLALCKLHHAAFDSFFFAVRRGRGRWPQAPARRPPAVMIAKAPSTRVTVSRGDLRSRPCTAISG